MSDPFINWAVREKQTPFLSPELCYKTGITHAAYNWARFHNPDWDEKQKASYDEGWKNGGGR